MRTFTNGIIWWSQDRWAGDRFASDVVMICKHLRTTFRCLCLELLPLWMWGGTPGEEPQPEPIPTTDEEREAEVKFVAFRVEFCFPEAEEWYNPGRECKNAISE